MNPQPTVLETATLPIELLPYHPISFVFQTKKEARGSWSRVPEFETALGDHFADPAGAYGATAFANRESLALFHGHRLLQDHFH